MSLLDILISCSGEREIGATHTHTHTHQVYSFDGWLLQAGVLMTTTRRRRKLLSGPHFSFPQTSPVGVSVVDGGDRREFRSRGTKAVRELVETGWEIGHGERKWNIRIFYYFTIRNILLLPRQELRLWDLFDGGGKRHITEGEGKKNQKNPRRVRYGYCPANNLDWFLWSVTMVQSFFFFFSLIFCESWEVWSSQLHCI